MGTLSKLKLIYDNFPGPGRLSVDTDQLIEAIKAFDSHAGVKMVPVTINAYTHAYADWNIVLVIKRYFGTGVALLRRIAGDNESYDPIQYALVEFSTDPDDIKVELFWSICITVPNEDHLRLELTEIATKLERQGRKVRHKYTISKTGSDPESDSEPWNGAPEPGYP